MTAVFKLLSKIYMPTSWITFAFTVIIYAIVGTFIHLIVATTKEEREMILSVLNKKKRPS